MDDSYVKVSCEEITIPTYQEGEFSKCPAFFKRRGYQEKLKKVYPCPYTNMVCDKKTDKKYKVIRLENKYIEIWIMPELGGRILKAVDKTNNSDFVYYNKVIKHAYTGSGLRIFGGIEFNFTIHQCTNEPVRYYVEKSDSDKETVWIQKEEDETGLKCTIGFTLYKDRAYLEVKSKICNSTYMPQKFFWSAKTSLSINDNTKMIFPQDVSSVFSIDKNEMSKFPYATGIYEGFDYSRGVDISRHKNTLMPISYTSYDSAFDFCGEYDYMKNTGVLHISDHHIIPEKNFRTCGTGDFGRIWSRKVTDEIGNIGELVTGTGIDSESDSIQINPFEEKDFIEYFVPYKDIGEVKNASKEAAVNLEFDGEFAEISIYAASHLQNVEVILKAKDRIILDEFAEILPERVFMRKIRIDILVEKCMYELVVKNSSGRVIISYCTLAKNKRRKYNFKDKMRPPKEVRTNEELYYSGVRLEDLHASEYDAQDYYIEGLKRDKTDFRINNSYGLILMKNGNFEESIKYFNEAARKITSENNCLYDCEPFYNLGVAFKYLGKLNEAFDMFYKAVWDDKYRFKSYLCMAQILCENKNYEEAVYYLNKIIAANYINLKARNLKCAVLRKQQNYKEALRIAKESAEINRVDKGARYELIKSLEYMNLKDEASTGRIEFSKFMNSSKDYIDLSIDYMNAGMYMDACDILRIYIESIKYLYKVNPMVFYYLSYYYYKLSSSLSREYLKLANAASSNYCFPVKLESIKVLENAIRMNPKDSRAHYYIGNILYDKKQYLKAINQFELSKAYDQYFPLSYRNIAVACYNNLHDKTRARSELEKAFELDENNAELLYELDLLYKRLNISCKYRLDKLENFFNLIEKRDDLYIEYVTLLNSTESFEKALDLIKCRKFNTWDGRKSPVKKQYSLSNIQIAKNLLEKYEAESAIKYLKAAKMYPDNIGEARTVNSRENNIDYYLGCAYLKLNDYEKSKYYFEKSAEGEFEASDMSFYSGLSLVRLGRSDKAKSIFNKLYDYGEIHIEDNLKTSCDKFETFYDNPNLKNKVNCLYLMGLGSLGLNKFRQASDYLKHASALDVSNQNAEFHYKNVFKILCAH